MKTAQTGKTLKTSLFLQARPDSPSDLELLSVDMSKYGYLPYGTVTATAEIPDDLPDPTELQIQALQAEYRGVQERASRELARIKDKIDSLQAITHQPEPAK